MPGEPLRLLIVEHDIADAELCAITLSQGGYDVTSRIAESPDELRACLAESEFDVVLADYRLPQWTGMDALAILRESGRDAPLILVTGTLGDERAVECLKQGAADYVLKANIGRLTTAVRRAIDEVRRAREARAATGEIRKLTLAVDQSPASVIITDSDGVIEYVNHRFVLDTGFSFDETVGQTPAMLQSGHTPASVYSDLWRTIRRGEVWHGEIENRTRAGNLRWHAVTISPIRDPAGTVTHFVATQTDITERRAAAQALREREERFQQLVDHIHEVFFVTKADMSETLYVSPAYQEIWGRSCQTLYEDPNSFIDAIPEEDRGPVFEEIRRAQQGEPAGDVEFRVMRPDGSVRWVLVHAVGIRNEDGLVYRISGVALDITERRQAVEALRESEALFRKLIEASFDGIDITQDGVVLEVNRGFAEMFGYEIAEAVGRKVTDFVADESIDEVSRRVADGIEGAYELIGKRKDGTPIQIEATSRTHTLGGKPARLTALRDVTERRLLEERYRQAQKMEAVGRLAGGVAHDFNNLLTVITSYSQLLQMDLPDGDPRRGDLDEVLRAAEAAASLTRQLLAFSRQQVVMPQLLAIEDVVIRTEKMLRRLIGEDIELATVLNPAPVTVKMDPGQLEQVILNLAVNSRDAMPRGGKLTLETASADLDATYVRAHWPATPGRYSMLIVNDNGIGMDRATQARIFEPFFTTKELGKGTGLGLSTVYGIVKQAGGFIWAYSEPGVGSTFKIYLPSQDEAPLAITQTRELAAVPRGTETILVAEDAAAVRSVVHEILRRHGYTVIDAATPAEALQLAARHRGHIDLLITDVVMPGIGGADLARQLAATRPGLRVLYMSGYTDDAVVRHGVLEPGIAFLQKPFSPEALARKVREVIEGK
jgi:two-component system cell cycle sensor histidine kinase/response regulator CckA